jgi:hypothetical protein
MTSSEVNKKEQWEWSQISHNEQKDIIITHNEALEYKSQNKAKLKGKNFI